MSTFLMDTYFKNGKNPYFKGYIFGRKCLWKIPYPSFKIHISRKIWFCKYGFFQNTHLQIRFFLCKYIFHPKYGFMWMWIFISCTISKIHILSNPYPGYIKNRSIQNFKSELCLNMRRSRKYLKIKHTSFVIYCS